MTDGINVSTLALEIEALGAIYGASNVEWIPASSETPLDGSSAQNGLPSTLSGGAAESCVKVTVSPHSAADVRWTSLESQPLELQEERRIELTFRLPATYPMEMGTVSIFPRWLLGTRDVAFERECAELGRDAVATAFKPGSEALFDLIEYIRERVVCPTPVVASAVPEAGSPGTRVHREGGGGTPGRGREAAGTPLLVSASSTLETRDSPDDVWLALGIQSGGTIVDRKSVFQAHIAAVKDRAEIQRVLDAVLRHPKVNRATHNIMAYRIQELRKPGVAPKQEPARLDGHGRQTDCCRKNKGRKTRTPAASSSREDTAAENESARKPSSEEGASVLQDHDSDGEKAAGGRLQHLLEILGVVNVIVIVSRWYGGTPLGPARFRHINNAARELILQTGIGNPIRKSSA